MTHWILWTFATLSLCLVSAPASGLPVTVYFEGELEFASSLASDYEIAVGTPFSGHYTLDPADAVRFEGDPSSGLVSYFGLSHGPGQFYVSIADIELSDPFQFVLYGRQTAGPFPNSLVWAIAPSPGAMAVLATLGIVDLDDPGIPGPQTLDVVTSLEGWEGNRLEFFDLARGSIGYGTIRIVPEPTLASLLSLACVALALRSRSR